jgi:hypothetical protein
MSRTNPCTNHDSWPKGIGFRKRVGKVWHYLQTEQCWKYEELPPIEILEALAFNCRPSDDDELDRANWFWNRRPFLLSTASCLLLFAVAFGLPFWIFVVPCLGLPLLVITILTVCANVAQSVSWRRQYESSIDRLIRTLTNDRDSNDVLS